MGRRSAAAVLIAGLVACARRIVVIPFGVPLDLKPGVGFYADFVVEGWILLELKAVPALTPEHTAQARQYLHDSGCRLCLLINFGTRPVEVQRLLPAGA